MECWDGGGGMTAVIGPLGSGRDRQSDKVSDGHERKITDMEKYLGKVISMGMMIAP